jgi:YVTN family beta-propeller protein
VGRRQALLIATYDHEDPTLRRLTSPAADVESLADVLRDPEIAAFEVTVLVNEPHHRVGAAVADLYRDRRRDDLTLLYFTGHGVKDEVGKLYLATSNTRRDDPLFSSLTAEQLDYAMENCASRQKILVLDCCYSGAFPAGRGIKGDTEVHTLEKFQGRGRMVLTASDSTQYAFEGNRVRGRATPSVFTRHLVEGLRAGAADLDGDGEITVDELYNYVHDHVVSEAPHQRPKMKSDVEGRIVIARNVAWRPAEPGAGPDPPEPGLEAPRGGPSTRVPAWRRSLAQRGWRQSLAVAAVIGAAAAGVVVVPGLVSDAGGAGPPAVPTVATVEIGTDSAGISFFSGGELAAVATATGLVLVDTVENRVVNMVDVPGQGLDVAVTPDNTRTYVATGAGLTEVDTSKPAVPGPNLVEGEEVYSVVAAADGDRVYAASPSGVVVVDPRAGAVVTTIELPGQKFGLAVSPDGTRLYVANSDLNSVSVIDTGTAEVIDTIRSGAFTLDVALSPTTARGYVAQEGAVGVFTTDARTPITNIPVPDGGVLEAVAVTPDGGRVFAVSRNGGRLFEIDAATESVIGSTTIDPAVTAGDIAVTDDRAYVTVRSGDVLDVLDISGG